MKLGKTLVLNKVGSGRKSGCEKICALIDLNFFRKRIKNTHFDDDLRIMKNNLQIPPERTIMLNQHMAHSSPHQCEPTTQTPSHLIKEPPKLTRSLPFPTIPYSTQKRRPRPIKLRNNLLRIRRPCSDISPGRIRNADLVPVPVVIDAADVATAVACARRFWIEGFFETGDHLPVELLKMSV